MWLLSWVPNSVLEHIVNLILISGAILSLISFSIIGKIVSWFPPLNAWVKLIQIISAIILIAGVYFKGSFQTEHEWRSKVAEAQAKVAEAEKRAREANEALDKKLKEKIKVIKGNEIIVKQYIDREVTKYDTTCPIPEPVVKAVNAAAKNEVVK